MPKVGQLNDDDDFKAAMAAREEFESGFKRSKRGNLWRYWQGKTLTIFKREDGCYGWCVSFQGDVRFGGGYEDEPWALAALWDATEGENWRRW
ncbi:MAG: hypothetical protein L0Y72_06540 [Gemmataceae bacterium]|nr:hypothetical protein [Gemmataceae bacterium]MCI0738684.1 hypothetical protein [Gemmataceae bacterium]